MCCGPNRNCGLCHTAMGASRHGVAARPGATPDVVVAELGLELGGELQALGLEVLSTPPERQGAWSVLRNGYGLPSDADLYALLHAKLMDARLITGDRDLRHAAEADGVQVNGLLWLMDELVTSRLVTTRAAAHGLQEILERGACLPADECERRLKGWRRASCPSRHRGGGVSVVGR